MVTRHTIRRKRHARHAFSAEAIEAYRELRALDNQRCTCPPKPEIPPWTGAHPDPADPRYRAYYSAPPPDCPACEARHEAEVKVHVLAGITPWESEESESQKMAALEAAAELAES